MLAEDNRAVIYKDVLKDVDVAYTVGTNVLKEDIILRAASAQNVFEFDVTAEGLTILEKEGAVFFVDSEGQKIFNLAPMYMEDASGKYSDKVEYAIDKHKDGYKLTIIADKEFLNAPDTQYPVIIDPSVMISGTSTKDTCVDQQYPTSNYYLSQNLWTGGAYGTNAMRTYIQFPLPTDIASAAVTSSYLRVKRNLNAVPKIRAYRVLSEWESADVKWIAQPAFDSGEYSTEAVDDSNNWYKMVVTTMVKDMMDNVDEDFGFCLKEPSETNSNQKTRFYSSDAPSPNKPELHIVYSGTYFNITYNGNGNTGGSVPASQWVQPMQSLALRTNTGNLTKTGCTLMGWNTNGAGTGTDYSLGQIITPYSNLTLYAKWSNYTITYNGNGNTGGTTPSSQLVQAGQSVALRTNTGNLTKTGCTLLGWNTNSAGTGTSYSLGQTITPTTNLTLYAEWGCTISYNGNNNTGGTVPASQTVVAGQSIALRMNTGNLTKTGYTLSGWNTNNAGTGTSYSFGQTITPTSNLTLYAEWSMLPVRLFYYDSGLPTNIPTIRDWFEDTGYEANSYYCESADAVRSYLGQSKIVHIEGHGASENGGAMWCTTTTILSATGNFTGFYPLSEVYTSGALQGCDFIFFAGCYTALSDPEYGDLDDYAYYTLDVKSTLAFEDEILYTGNGDPNYGTEKFIKSFYDHMLNDGKKVSEAAALARDESILLWEDWGLDSFVVHGDTTF